MRRPHLPKFPRRAAQAAAPALQRGREFWIILADMDVEKTREFILEPPARFAGPIQPLAARMGRAESASEANASTIRQLPAVIPALAGHGWESDLRLKETDLLIREQCGAVAHSDHKLAGLIDGVEKIPPRNEGVS